MLECQKYCWGQAYVQWAYSVPTKVFQGFGLGQIRRLTAATAAITLACLFVEMLCYVLGRNQEIF